MQKTKEKAPEKITKSYTPAWQNIFRTSSEQQDSDILNVLKKTRLFSQLTRKELKKISLIIYERAYFQGEYLFREGNPGSAMYIIKNGTISVEKTNLKGEKFCYATLISGDFLGETTLLEDNERTVNARCTTKSSIIIIFKHDLFDLIAREPILGTKVLKELASMTLKRLNETNDELLKCKLQLEGKNAQ